MIISRRGALGDMFVVFAFIFLMSVVGGGIVIGTLIYIGDGYDFRASDASLLGVKIEGCANNGFDIGLLGGTGDVSEKIGLLSEKCGFNKTILESYYKIKICERKLIKTEGDCILTSNAVLTFGDVQPCGFTDSSKFLGCSGTTTNDYIIITATNQKLRRNAK